MLLLCCPCKMHIFTVRGYTVHIILLSMLCTEFWILRFTYIQLSSTIDKSYWKPLKLRVFEICSKTKLFCKFLIEINRFCIATKILFSGQNSGNFWVKLRDNFRVIHFEFLSWFSGSKAFWVISGWKISGNFWLKVEIS